MIIRYCDKCGQKINEFDEEKMSTSEWFTLVRHGLMSPISLELCDKCFCEVASNQIKRIRKLAERSE